MTKYQYTPFWLGYSGGSFSKKTTHQKYLRTKKLYKFYGYPHEYLFLSASYEDDYHKHDRILMLLFTYFPWEKRKSHKHSQVSCLTPRSILISAPFHWYDIIIVTVFTLHLLLTRSVCILWFAVCLTAWHSQFFSPTNLIHLFPTAHIWLQFAIPHLAYWNT